MSLSSGPQGQAIAAARAAMNSCKLTEDEKRKDEQTKPILLAQTTKEKAFSFLLLPYEIRRQIFDFLCTEAWMHIHMVQRDQEDRFVRFFEGPVQHDLALTCWQFYDEIRPILAKNIQLHISFDWDRTYCYFIHSVLRNTLFRSRNLPYFLKYARQYIQYLKFTPQKALPPSFTMYNAFGLTDIFPSLKYLHAGKFNGTGKLVPLPDQAMAVVKGCAPPPWKGHLALECTRGYFSALHHMMVDDDRPFCVLFELDLSPKVTCGFGRGKCSTVKYVGSCKLQPRPELCVIVLELVDATHRDLSAMTV